MDSKSKMFFRQRPKELHEIQARAKTLSGFLRGCGLYSGLSPIRRILNRVLQKWTVKLSLVSYSKEQFNSALHSMIT